MDPALPERSDRRPIVHGVSSLQQSPALHQLLPHPVSAHSPTAYAPSLLSQRCSPLWLGPADQKRKAGSIHQPLWDAVQAQLASNAAQRNDGGKIRPPNLLAGMLFDGDGNRMTPSHAVKRAMQ